MKTIIITLLLALCSLLSFAQGCLPEGITFTLQSQVDSFQVNYPGCTEIEGDVKIRGTGISDLYGLNVLTAIGGNLEIGNLGPDNPDLHNLMGLENLNHIGGILYINSTDSLFNLLGMENLHSIDSGLYLTFNKSLADISSLANLDSIGGGIGITMNYDLESLTGLEGLETVQGDISIYYNNLLTDLTGLINIISIGGKLYIGENENLVSLSGLNNLTTIGGDLLIGPTPPGHEAAPAGRNASLATLDGLNSLTAIGGNLAIYGNDALVSLDALENLQQIGKSLEIGGLYSYNGIVNYYLDGNNSLTSLSGLQNISASSIDSLYITGNALLSSCDVQCICEYLGSPNGTIDIYGNGTGCNSVQEIANACGIELSCLPQGNYYLGSQLDIDNFQVDFPGCTDLSGNMTIRGSNITNLWGLNSINTVEGSLNIGSTTHLEDLTGLSGLSYVRSFGVFYNTGLKDLTGLESLNHVSTFCAYNNDSLLSLTGLENLDTVRSISLGVQFNFVEWYGNPMLDNIEALDNLYQDSLESFKILFNPSLSECAIASVCQALTDPGIAISIYENAPGCNSQEEVKAACEVGVGESAVGSQQSSVICYPNPTRGIVDFRFSNFDGRWVSLKVYNAQGQEVAVVLDKSLLPCEHTVRWDAGVLPAGIYYYRLSTDDYRLTTCGKIVKY